MSSQPSGLRPPLGRSPIFDAIKSGRGYFVLARNEDKWGTLTHLRITPELPWADSYLPTNGDDFIAISNKFFDRNTDRRYSGIISDAGKHVYIARAPKGTTVLTLEDQAVTGILSVEYLGQKWASISGMKDWTPDYDLYDYFLLNFNAREATKIKIDKFYFERFTDGAGPASDGRVPDVTREIAMDPRCDAWMSDVIGMYQILPNSTCLVNDTPITVNSVAVTIPVTSHQQAKRGTVANFTGAGSDRVRMLDGHTFRRGDRIYLGQKYYTVVGISTTPGSGYIQLSPMTADDIPGGYELVSLVNRDHIDLVAFEEWTVDVGIVPGFISVEGLVHNSVPQETYRVVGVVIDPRDKNGELCTADFVPEIDLFDPTENTYHFGCLAHIAAVVPVRRIDLPEAETIRILM